MPSDNFNPPESDQENVEEPQDIETLLEKIKDMIQKGGE